MEELFLLFRHISCHKQYQPGSQAAGKINRKLSPQLTPKLYIFLAILLKVLG
jgi:hypothetical protein